jgi:hypothetical protein
MLLGLRLSGLPGALALPGTSRAETPPLCSVNFLKAAVAASSSWRVVGMCP